MSNSTRSQHPAPQPLTVAQAQQGPSLTPREILKTYDADEWEVFVEEWATGFDPPFVEIARFGGTGDEGVDVAGFHTRQGFQGRWECFQCKYYSSSLALASAWPEILKLFRAVIAHPAWTMPERYYFLAPEGMKTSLAQKLHAPTELREGFLEQLSSKSKPFAELTGEQRDEIRDLATQTDFSIFGTVEVRDLIDQHRRTPYFLARFGGALLRPTPDPVPTLIDESEVNYLKKLVDVYSETYGEKVGTLAEVAKHTRASAHLQRQRESFFRAESLKRFARDSVPPETFEGLQREIFDAIIETVEAPHPSSMERLRQTLDRAVTAQLSANALIQVTEPADRKGICHQLANEDQVEWVDEK